MVFETFLAKLVLGESVSGLRWTGVFLDAGIAGDLIGCVGQIHPGMEGGHHVVVTIGIANSSGVMPPSAVGSARCRMIPVSDAAAGFAATYSPFGILTFMRN